MQSDELELHIDFLLSTALKKCRNLDDAKDLTQETLLSAIVFLSGGGTIDNIKAWLLTVLNRKYYDLLRKKYKLPTVSYEYYFDSADDNIGIDDAIDTSEVEKIRREIAYLSKLYREVMIRHYLKNESVEHIASELNIPVGTVKSRLSAGRGQLKKGIDTMKNYTKQSYEPERLEISNSGRFGLNDEPFSLTNNNLIAQNILILSYDEPVTQTDLAKAIGIPTAYIEPIIDNLVQGELLKLIGNKVYTDFIIYTVRDKQKYIPAQRTLVEENFDLLWQPLAHGLECLRATPPYKAMREEQKQKYEYYFIIHCLDVGLYAVFSKIFDAEQIFPDRPHGGKWIAMGHRYPINYDFTQDEFFKYCYSGEQRAYLENFLESKSLHLCAFDTPLEENVYYKGKLGISAGELSRMLYIIHENINPEDIGFNLMLFESIPYLEECGVLKQEGMRKILDIPVISKSDFNDNNSIYDKVVDEWHTNLTPVMTTHFRNKKIPIPKHLKSVPIQKQYMKAMNSIHMLTVYRARKQGCILKDINYPCPPMVLVIDK